ncbi:methyltransferase domain-containing protein [Acuticoccus kandeliae]|uniref:methyltransferase domain-containing protein n=1 Tax=Acuticoccus kandeliae TaxID=2073160 RepID=UPI0013007E4D|nr:methyltransferase domain-containing protein [Acuticoccus kandeliae]
MEKLRQDGFDPDNVTENELQTYDQDHYGGLAANDALAAAAGIDAGTRVLDVCCGMGGPARYLAHNIGCRVTGIDLTESRIVGARRLTEMAGLSDRVDYEVANALDLPFDDATFDVLVSQEAFCHVPDKPRLVSECVRVLKPGGRLAFTDVLTTEHTREAALKRLQAEITFQELSTEAAYRALLEGEGCTVTFVDLAEPWANILANRLAMYRGLKEQTVARYGEAHFDRWDSAYNFFVSLYRTGEMGGGRFVARKPL